MTRVFGLRVMLYFVVIMYGCTCCLLYIVITDYKIKRDRQVNGHGTKYELLGNLTNEKYLNEQNRTGNLNEMHNNQQEKLPQPDMPKLTSQGPGFKFRGHKLMLGDRSPIKTSNQSQYSLGGRDFQTLVRSSCPQSKQWPVIPVQQGVLDYHSQENPKDDCASPHFSRHPLPQTALASFPGCGNTWSRHLIQQLSGIWTGSLYNDPDLFNGGFWGEGVRNESVIALKTHWPYVKPNASAVENYPRTVLVIRSPQHCLLAEYHRRYSHDHTGLAPAQLFNGTKWNYFVRGQVKFWFWFYESWLKKDTCTLVLDYQRLQSDLAAELRQLALFLGIQGDRLDDNIKCILKHSQGKFKRKGKKTLSVFNEQQRKEVEHYGKLLSDLLKRKANYEPVFSW